MKTALRILPIACATAFIAVGEIKDFPAPLMAGLGLGMAAGLIPVMLLLRRWDQASMVEWGMSVFVALGGLSFALGPGGAGRAVAGAPVAVLYGVLFCLVALPPLFGGPLFTEHFAKKTTPQAVWQTDVFQKINRNMTLVWACLFAACALSALMPLGFSPPAGPVPHIVFFAFIPLALLLGVGLPFTKKYPAYYQRRLGLEPVHAQAAPPPPSAVPAQPRPAPTRIKEETMSANGKIVAINGSPHQGIGNTAQLIEMLRPTLEQEGFALEVISLGEKEIDYCVGCGVCIEKGKCWIPDDHRGIVQQLLAAEAVILAAPVYFYHVPAQMKTFLDRSLAWGHKPQGTFKPGLAISVAAAFGEVEVADYLARLLHVYGAFSVGTLTALATGPGEFLGLAAVQARAADLARDLVRAIKEKRRYPVTSAELFYWLHIGWLVNKEKDGVMADDYRHWQQLGLNQSFDKYVGQEWAPGRPYNQQARQAWIQQMIAERKAKKAGRVSAAAPAPTPAQAKGPQDARTCRELLEMMPLGFNPQAAGDLKAAVQFEVSGSESFVAHLDMAEGKCRFVEGPTASPNLVIKTPAEVWLAVAKGQMDGQAAFMGGKYTVSGDITLLMRFKELFSRGR
ncbi:MAG: NAD(P)H-dependent oxidoreductase [Thermodesulfobacteriota bacterium]